MSSLFTAIVFKFHMHVNDFGKNYLHKQDARLLSEEFSEDFSEHADMA